MEINFDMNQWGYIKDKLRNKYPELTDADMIWGRVNRDEMLKMISAKLGKTKKDLMAVIAAF
jgi:hypothetical protein